MRITTNLLIALAVTGCAALQATIWTPAGNPHIVNGSLVIPPGQSLILQPGVIVQISANSTLEVDGQLLSQGVSANHVVVTGADYTSAVMVHGTLNFSFTDVSVKVLPDTNGSLVFSDSTFSGLGSVINVQMLLLPGSRPPYIQFDRSTFQGDGTTASANLYMTYCTAVLRNTKFLNGSWGIAQLSYVYADNLTSDHSSGTGIQVGGDADLYLNNLTVTNAAFEGLLLAGDTRNGANVMLGPNVSLSGNQYPVGIQVNGLFPGSTVPATGNLNNSIHVTGLTAALLPNLGLPYYVDSSPALVGSRTQILPGATIMMAPFAYLNVLNEGLYAIGTPQAPVSFIRSNAGRPWSMIHAADYIGGKIRNVIVDGSDQGVNGGQWVIENSVIRHNQTGTNGLVLVSGTQYLNNILGHDGISGNGVLNGGLNPNWFQGNTLATQGPIDARNSWWNAPSGPATSRNPGGTGDPLGASVLFTPFYTAAPNLADQPPSITLMRPAFAPDPASKLTLVWNAQDDNGIVSQQILFSPVGEAGFSFMPIATLPPDQRSYELTVPTIGFQVAGTPSYVRVVAVDDTGKQSYDEMPVLLPTDNGVAGDITFNVTAGQVFRPGEVTGQLWTLTGGNSGTVIIEQYVEILDVGPRKLYGQGMPYLSTDAARLVVGIGNTTNRAKYFYSPLFQIRPDPQLGDAPPSVHVLSPQVGQQFPSGVVVPISWSASDDEGIRAFDINVSGDGGRNWSALVQDLPRSATTYNWQTAPNANAADVRVMVIAKDIRFQMSSDGAQTSFQVGDGTPVPTVASLTLNPPNITAGLSSQGVVTLSAPAPAGGALVFLSGDNGNATVPQTMTIPAGETSGTFTITTILYINPFNVDVTAGYGGVTLTAVLSVTPSTAPAALASLVLNPSSVTGGKTSTLTVTLTNVAPPKGAVVKLSSSNPAVVKAPASVKILSGFLNLSTSVLTGTVTARTTVTVTGTYAGVTKTASLTVTPRATDTVRITKAVYTAATQQLQIQATDTVAAAVLKAYVTSTNALIGALTSGGDGTYTGQFSLPSNPQHITVRSDHGGTATVAVTLQ
jgi:hypothetical protein